MKKLTKIGLLVLLVVMMSSFMVQAVDGFKDFVMTDVKWQTHKVWWNSKHVGDLSTGIKVMWVESWIVDEYGTKIYLVNSTQKTIFDSWYTVSMDNFYKWIHQSENTYATEYWVEGFVEHTILGGTEDEFFIQFVK